MPRAAEGSCAWFQQGDVTETGVSLVRESDTPPGISVSLVSTKDLKTLADTFPREDISSAKAFVQSP